MPTESPTSLPAIHIPIVPRLVPCAIHENRRRASIALLFPRGVRPDQDGQWRKVQGRFAITLEILNREARQHFHFSSASSPSASRSRSISSSRWKKQTLARSPSTVWGSGLMTRFHRSLQGRGQIRPRPAAQAEADQGRRVLRAPGREQLGAVDPGESRLEPLRQLAQAGPDRLRSDLLEPVGRRGPGVDQRPRPGAVLEALGRVGQLEGVALEVEPLLGAGSRRR